jgi:hypothetical protein
MLVGQNFPPITFKLSLEYLYQDIEGERVSFFQVDGCPLYIDKLITRGFMDPKAYADLQKARKEAGPIKLTNSNFPM